MGSAPSSGPGAAARRQQPVPWREIFSGALGRLAFGLFLLEALTAVQILVVATVMPVIARDLSGLRLYGWAFSAGGLATVITIPLGGMAVDRIGPRTSRATRCPDSFVTRKLALPDVQRHRSLS